MYRGQLLKIQSVITDKIAFYKAKEQHVPYQLYETFFNVELVLELGARSANKWALFAHRHNLSHSHLEHVSQLSIHPNAQLVRTIYPFVN